MIIADSPDETEAGLNTHDGNCDSIDDRASIAATASARGLVFFWLAFSPGISAPFACPRTQGRRAGSPGKVCRVRNTLKLSRIEHGFEKLA